MIFKPFRKFFGTLWTNITIGSPPNKKNHQNIPTTYSIYLNGYWFDHLMDDYNERPEPARMLQRSLWTIYQLLKLGQHEVTIVNKDKQIELQTKRTYELKSWLEEKYPYHLIGHLSSMSSSSPHPSDLLRNRQ